MEPLIGLDVPLAFLGLFALRLAAGGWFSRHARRSLGTIVLLLLGVGSMATAALDVGLSEWDKAERSLIQEEQSPYNARVELRAGALAPDFTLPSLDDGRPIRLGDFRGRKPVLLLLSSFT